MMASYFNKTRGPVTVSLKNGESSIVGPKKVMVVSPEQDGSASLHAMVRRGLLIKLKEPTLPQIQEVSPVEDALELPSMQWTKSHLIEHAESLDLDVSSSWTKVEILQAIEETS